MAGWPRRPQKSCWVAMLLMLALVLTACGDGADQSPPQTSSPAGVSSPAVCGYLYEWLSSFWFPLQPDPHAAYSYVIPKISNEPVALEITGQFPFAAWTSWTIYTDLQAGVQPFSVVRDAAITPNEGSVNPFVVGKPVLAPKRDYRLLVLPEGTDTTTIDESLRDIPASNILSRPTTGGFYILANRVYNAFPGYNQGGAAGPTNTPFPTVRAVNYQTGHDSTARTSTCSRRPDHRPTCPPGARPPRARSPSATASSSP